MTGANGFVGYAICARLRESGIRYRAVAREALAGQAHSDFVPTGNIEGKTDWKDALLGVRTVIHLAARVHVMHETQVVPLAEFRRTNVEGTENLARQAMMAGVVRLVYVSSVKVKGELTTIGHPFRAGDKPGPPDP